MGLGLVHWLFLDGGRSECELVVVCKKGVEFK